MTNILHMGVGGGEVLKVCGRRGGIGGVWEEGRYWRCVGGGEVLEVCGSK